MAFLKSHAVPFLMAVAAVVVGLVVAPKVIAAVSPKPQA